MAFAERALHMPPGHFEPRLPSGHPAPGHAQMSAVIVEAEKQAARNPKDIAVWNRYGDLAMRFAIFNPANYRKAQDAFTHVLALDPGNREALRGIGDVYFDTRQYQNAIQAYRRYLRGNSDDTRVRTDLGTMYLSEHQEKQALKEYRLALAYSPDFFPARFNAAVAYLLLKDYTKARAALVKARTVAPDSGTRTRIDEMIATVDQNSLRDSGPRASNSSSPGVVSKPK